MRARWFCLNAEMLLGIGFFGDMLVGSWVGWMFLEQLALLTHRRVHWEGSWSG